MSCSIILYKVAVLIALYTALLTLMLKRGCFYELTVLLDPLCTHKTLHSSTGIVFQL